MVAPTVAQTLRPLELLAKAETYRDRTVEVEIVEPLGGPATPAALARVEYGQVEIEIPEVASGSLVLVPPSFRLEDASRYRRKFDRVLVSPARARGELLLDEEMAKSYGRPVYVLRIMGFEPLALGQPEVVHSTAELDATPSRWDRRFVEYEGNYRHGFEISALDGKIWLETNQHTRMTGEAGTGSALGSGGRVRVRGVLFAHPGARYGHLGGYTYQLNASSVEYLRR